MKVLKIILLIFLVVWAAPYASAKLTAGTPDEAAEFAIGVCLGTLDNLDRTKVFAKKMDWKIIPKEEIATVILNQDLEVDAWLAIDKNHPYVIMVNEMTGALKFNRFIGNTKSNQCTFVDPYSDPDELFQALSKNLILKKVYRDMGDMFPLEHLDAYKVINPYHTQKETYLLFFRNKNKKPPTSVIFMSEQVKPK